MVILAIGCFWCVIGTRVFGRGFRWVIGVSVFFGRLDVLCAGVVGGAFSGRGRRLLASVIGRAGQLAGVKFPARLSGRERVCLARASVFRWLVWTWGARDDWARFVPTYGRGACALAGRLARVFIAWIVWRDGRLARACC